MTRYLCALLLLIASQTTAQAQSLSDEAEAQFQLGTRAYQTSDFDAALVHFMQSNRLSPNHNTATNVGHVYVAKSDFPAAYRWYALAKELAPEKVRARIEGSMNDISDRVHLVRLNSTPPGANVYVNRVDLGVVAVTPAVIAIPPGEYLFIMELTNHKGSQTESVTIEGLGETTEVELELEPIVGEIALNGREGAKVSFEESGAELGVLPLVARLPPAPTVLLVELEGYKAERVIVNPVEGETKAVEVTLQPLTGQVEFQASTVGSRIEVDGELAGFTPRLLDLPIGSHEVTVRSPGTSPYSTTVEVTEGSEIVVNARLRRQLTVVSASNRAESIEEAPAPVTIITSEMIRNSGVRNLQEALTLFVPGMSVVTDHNELNVAMRGVYASSQQKILIMRDGHRLNSRAYSMANPDFSIMIDPHSVEQIEVVRGPGSSIYGNVALTAVVNIITRATNPSDGPTATARTVVGNFGQLGASGSVRTMVTEGSALESWASVFRADGELVQISAVDDYNPEPQAGVARINGVESPASYDIGGRYRNGRFTAHLQGRYGKHTEPFTGGGVTGQVYDPDEVPHFGTTGTGLGSFNQHLDVGYRIGTDDLSVQLTAYGDTNEIRGLLATSPTSGLVIDWKEYAIGTTNQLQADWEVSGLGDGGLIAGVQLETTSLYDSFALSSEDSYDVEVTWGEPPQQLLLPGNEQTYAGFFQLRQRLGKTLLVNAGGRLDYKIRRQGDNIVEAQDPIAAVSPRFAVNWSPVSAFDLKASFAGSFVDAPYWYRYTTLPTFAGAVGLEPELLQAFQLTPTVKAFEDRLRVSLNGAYNQFSQLTFRDNTADPELGEPFYRSSGALDTVTAELASSYVATRLNANVNATYQYVLLVDDYTAQGNRIDNVPSFFANAQASGNLADLELGSLWLGGAARFRGLQAAPIRGVSISRPNADANLENELDPYVLLDATARVSDIVTPGLSLDVTVTNLLDKQWFQGGSTLHPYPMPGRWVLAGLQYDFGAG